MKFRLSRIEAGSTVFFSTPPLSRVKFKLQITYQFVLFGALHA